MLVATEKDVLRCAHVGGVVDVSARHRWIRINGSPVLVRPDALGRSITGCPMVGATTKPCTSTVTVDTGYSQFVRIDGSAMGLNTLSGFTDGVPPMSVLYSITSNYQSWVSER